MTIDIGGGEPLLVFGGPYSNLRAMQALVLEAERLGIEPQRVICTGDVVAYGAEPVETVALIRAWGCHVIKGNCEESLAERSGDCGCNFEEGSVCALLSKGWYPYADATIGDDERDWMNALPASLTFQFGGRTFRVVHGGCREIARWVFQSQDGVLDEEIALSGAEITIAGHAGLPFVARRDDGIWFNPGVIGMPANDGTPDGWYGIIAFDAATGGVTLSTHRLGYENVAAAASMRRAGHANEYARTLITGRWPSLDVLPAEERLATGREISPVSLIVGEREPTAVTAARS